MHKNKFRAAMGVALYELGKENRYMVAELFTELSMIYGYIGYVDGFDNKLRLFVFDKLEDAEKACKEAKKIGFTSAGMVEGMIFVSNANLTRPHLKYKRKNEYYRELYR